VREITEGGLAARRALGGAEAERWLWAQ